MNSQPPRYDAVIRAFRLISGTSRSILRYGAFAEFLQMEVGLLGSWGIEVAHTCIRLNVPPSTRRAAAGATN